MTASNPPTDRKGVHRWLLAHEEATARLTRKALRAIVRDAWRDFAASLTADAAPPTPPAGDLGALDAIPGRWMTFVGDTLVPALGEIHLRGAMAMWLALPVQPPPEFAEAWTAVVNENAVSYMAQATNRLAQVGDETWRRIRTQTTNAIRDGLTNEELKAKIEGLTKFSEARADTVARTETIGAYVNGDMTGARALGDRGPTEKVWVATVDNRTRESHVEAHNQTRPMAEPFDVGGYSMDAPHAPGAPAREVVNCRCYCEHLYPGDSRPDDSIVPETPGAVPPPLVMP